MWCLPDLESWPPGVLYHQGIVITILSTGFYYIQDYNKAEPSPEVTRRDIVDRLQAQDRPQTATANPVFA